MSPELKLTFYVGVCLDDRDAFMKLFNEINESALYRMIITGQYNNIRGYHTYSIRGTWSSYKKFLDGPGFIKSVEHFEDL